MGLSKKYDFSLNFFYIFTHKILPSHPTSFILPFLDSSGYFLSENIYFCRGRVHIYLVMTIYVLIGARFSDLGGVTHRGASSKRMAIAEII